MEKPKKEDFEYYQNGLAFKTVNLIEYTKALELYINEIEALNMRSVAVMFNDKHTPNFDRAKCTCKKLAFKVGSLKIETHPEAESHFLNDRLVCYFKH